MNPFLLVDFWWGAVPYWKLVVLAELEVLEVETVVAGGDDIFIIFCKAFNICGLPNKFWGATGGLIWDCIWAANKRTNAAWALFSLATAAAAAAAAAYCCPAGGVVEVWTGEEVLFFPEGPPWPLLLTPIEDFLSSIGSPFWRDWIWDQIMFWRLCATEIQTVLISIYYI